VRHSAGILDLKDWINPLHGYQYDSMNKDALLNMPFNYKVLVIPEGCIISKEVQKRIEQLRQQGVVIIDKPWRTETIEGIERDVILPEGIAYTHRATAEQDIYFLANQMDKEREITASFRSTGRIPYIYDPVTDEVTQVDYSEENGRTKVTFTMPAFGSLFIPTQGIQSSHAGNPEFPRRESRVPTQGIIENSYHITFKESNITLDNQQLFDWSQHPDERIRYFSGHAMYTTTLKMKKQPAGRAWIQLPDVKDIAHVWVNGIDCGIAWTAPYEVEVTKALQKGKNKIEIEVVNTWHNALRGMDAGKSPYEGIWTNAKYRTKGDNLLPAGLLAQPELKIEQ
jgi:hypothetical protein